MLESNHRPLTYKQSLSARCLVGTDGVEPSTSSLSEKRSTAELNALFDKRRLQLADQISVLTTELPAQIFFFAKLRART